jgi:hypothetical protein
VLRVLACFSRNITLSPFHLFLIRRCHWFSRLTCNTAFCNTFPNVFTLQVSPHHFTLDVSANISIIKCLKIVFDGNWRASGFAVSVLSMYSHLCPVWNLYPQKLALTSSTSGGRPVGIVHLRTQATGVFSHLCACASHMMGGSSCYVLWKCVSLRLNQWHLLNKSRAAGCYNII